MWTSQLATHQVGINNKIKAPNEENSSKLTQMNKLITDGMNQQKKMEESHSTSRKGRQQIEQAARDSTGAQIQVKQWQRKATSPSKPE